MFEILLTTQAKRAYLNLDAKTQNRVDKVLEMLEKGQFQHGNIRALHGELTGLLRYRLGSWRIVFRIDHPNRRVIIEAITQRGGAYR